MAGQSVMNIAELKSCWAKLEMKLAMIARYGCHRMKKVMNFYQCLRIRNYV